MKSTVLTGILLAVSMTAIAQTLTITADIPGIRKGCKVELCTDDDKILANGITDDGGFRIDADVTQMVLAKLSICDKPSYAEGEYPTERGVRLMIERGADIKITAASLDSVPLLYELGNSPLFLEPCVRVEGGKAQAHYQEWRKWIYNAERARWQAEHLQWTWLSGKRKNKPDTGNLLDLMEKAVSAAQEVENSMNTMFIRRHPEYAISLMLQKERLGNAFVYNSEELDSMVVMFMDNEDQAGYERLVKKADKMRQFTRGTHYADFGITMPDGTECKFSGLVKPGVWNYIDFWASWCGPCRAAIPGVKRLHAGMGDKINIVSVSVDKKPEDWKLAMEQEQMPWTQAMVTREAAQTLKEKYRLSAIPLIVIIDPEGNIQTATHTPAKADKFITEKLRN